MDYNYNPDYVIYKLKQTSRPAAEILTYQSNEISKSTGNINLSVQRNQQEHR
jgi:hypothetical protein